MFSLIRQMFTALLSFSSSLARHRTKYISLNQEPTWLDLLLLI